MNNAIIPETMNHYNSSAGHFLEFKLLSHNTAKVDIYYEDEENEGVKSDELAKQFKGGIMEALSFYYEIYHAHEPVF
ncbi:hypothetical protein [Endozoicomonas atrinae]|uniref:hypothetical protein n=1 Tax=Endozoicomonas atrinae TaxID=1333660 RepID=UPI0008252AA8|nr:hypothetical protein [Endozoicomonas atrinae]